MCLKLRDDSYSPYNSSKIRWKLVRVRGNEYAAPYAAPYQNTIYSFGVNIDSQRKETECERETRGFHVFVSRQEARIFKKKYLNISRVRVVKVSVEDFSASGGFCGFRSETWSKMTILT